MGLHNNMYQAKTSFYISGPLLLVSPKSQSIVFSKPLFGPHFRNPLMLAFIEKHKKSSRRKNGTRNPPSGSKELPKSQRCNGPFDNVFPNTQREHTLGPRCTHIGPKVRTFTL